MTLSFTPFSVAYALDYPHNTLAEVQCSIQKLQKTSPENYLQWIMAQVYLLINTPFSNPLNTCVICEKPDPDIHAACGHIFHSACAATCPLEILTHVQSS